MAWPTSEGRPKRSGIHAAFAAEAVIVDDGLAGTVGQEPPLDKPRSGSTDRPVIKDEKTSVKDVH